MKGPDHFIQRWARLKRASKAAAEKSASSSVETPAAPPQAEGAPDRPFDPASLPSLEQIVADTDIGAFLQSGVPAELTRAVLRRAWVSDPAIRDFIGIAENQWDFNDPNGIPGFGALPSAGGAPAVVTQVLSKLENIPEAVSELSVSVELDRPHVSNPEPTPGEACFAASAISDAPGAPEAGEVTEGDRVAKEYDALHHRRRHGSALPR
jgi:hypothetical protein